MGYDGTKKIPNSQDAVRPPPHKATVVSDPHALSQSKAKKTLKGNANLLFLC